MSFKMVRRTFLKLMASTTAALARLVSLPSPTARGGTVINTDANTNIPTHASVSANAIERIQLSAIAVTVGEVELTWKTPAAAGTVTRYGIYRNATLLASGDGTLSIYNDTTVTQGRFYLYTVIAFNAANAAVATSLPTRVTTPDVATYDIWPPAPPEGLTAIAVPGVILLDWYGGNDDTDITCYLIRRNGLRLARVDSGTLEYRDTTVRSSRLYIYTVQAIDTMGNRSSLESVTIRSAASQSAVESAESEPAELPDSHVIYMPVIANESSGASSENVLPTSLSDITESVASAQQVSSVASAAAYSSNLRRYPYLTDLVGPYVTINWATDDSNASGFVTYGAVGSESPTAHTVAATRSTIRVNSVNEYQWKAMLTLTPDTQYAYRIFLGSGTPIDLLGTDPAPEFWTQIPAGSSKVFSFVVVGDWGDVDNAAAEQANLIALIAQSGALFGLTTGDNSYPSGSQSNYGDLVQTGPSISGTFRPQGWPVAGRTLPLFPAIGNHGISNADTAGNSHLLTWPQQKAAQLSNGRYVSENYSGIDGTTARNYPSAWFAFDAGVARFYVLHAAWHDTNLGNASSPYQVDYDYHWTPGSAQVQWLTNDLAAHPSALKFAFFHYPLYTDNNTERSDTYLQGANSLEGLLTNYGVHLAFSGHAHLYQRNNANGLTSYVLGATGVKLQPLDLGCTSVDAFGLGWSNSKSKGYSCGAAAIPTSKQQVYNFVKVTVDGTTVTVTPQNSLGQIFDEQVFNFSVGGPPPTATVVPPTPTQMPTSTPTPTGAPATSTSTPTLTRTPTSTPTPTGAPATSTSTPTPTQTPTSTPTPTGAPATSTSTPTPTQTPTPTGAPVTSTSTLTPTQTPTSTSTPTGAPATSTSTPTPTQTSTSTPTPTGAPATSTSTPTPGSVVFQDGFESGNLSAWTTNGGLTVQPATVHAGSFAAQANTTNGTTYAKKVLPATYTDGYGRIYFNLVSYSSQVNVLRFRTAADGSLAYLFINTAGNLGLKNDVAGTTLTSTTSVGSGWHALELHAIINGASGSTEVWLDGVRINDLSITTNLGTTPIGRLQIGEVQNGRTYNLILDDAVFATQPIGL